MAPALGLLRRGVRRRRRFHAQSASLHPAMAGLDRLPAHKSAYLRIFSRAKM